MESESARVKTSSFSILRPASRRPAHLALGRLGSLQGSLAAADSWGYLTRGRACPPPPPSSEVRGIIVSLRCWAWVAWSRDDWAWLEGGSLGEAAWANRRTFVRISLGQERKASSQGKPRHASENQVDADGRALGAGEKRTAPSSADDFEC